MNKIILILILSFYSTSPIYTQQIASQVFHWEDPTLVGSLAYNNTYNECWGVVINEREIAIIGSTEGTHFFDITEPSNAVEIEFISGSYAGTGVIHRDYHDFQGYLYAVCDEGNNSTLQIIDISNLPDSAITVYDSNQLFSKSHNIFIDTATAKLYVCAVKHTVPNNFSSALEVYSLIDPLNPILIYTYNNVNHIHDVYVRNDTAYLNCGNDGFKIIDFHYLDLLGGNPIELASLTSYPDAGYNHSGWLNNDGNIYAMQDENHGYDVKLLDVSDFNNISVLSTFNSGNSQSMAHNGIIKDNLLYLAYYHDGLRVFDISDPINPVETCSYKTYLCGDYYSYKGAWGVYPYLPSGNIIISDMQSGLFVVNCNTNSTWNCNLGKCEDPGNGTGTYNILDNCILNCGIPSWDCNNGVCEDPGDGTGIYPSKNCCKAECLTTSIYIEDSKNMPNIVPHPVDDNFHIISDEINGLFELYNNLGQKIKSITLTSNKTMITRGNLKQGIYFYKISNKDVRIDMGKIVFR